MSDEMDVSLDPSQQLQDEADEAFRSLDEYRAMSDNDLPRIECKHTPLSSTLQRRLKTEEDMYLLDFDMKFSQAIIHTNKQLKEVPQNIAYATRRLNQTHITPLSPLPLPPSVNDLVDTMNASEVRHPTMLETILPHDSLYLPKPAPKKHATQNEDIVDRGRPRRGMQRARLIDLNNKINEMAAIREDSPEGFRAKLPSVLQTPGSPKGWSPMKPEPDNRKVDQKLAAERIEPNQRVRIIRGPWRCHTGMVTYVRTQDAMVLSDVDGKAKKVPRHHLARLDSLGKKIVDTVNEMDMK